MAITTVRPNATASGSSLFTISGGSGSLHQVLYPLAKESKEFELEPKQVRLQRQGA